MASMASSPVNWVVSAEKMTVVASQLSGIGSEDDGDLTLVAQVVVDRGIAFFLGVGGQEVGDVLLIVQTQCRKHAEGRDNQQYGYREGLVFRQVVVDIEEELVHRDFLLFIKNVEN